jgi:N-acetylneuraminic acid mutarotase
VICAGGETEIAKSTSRAFMMFWDEVKHDVVFADLPSLPISLANACISTLGQKVYVIGGETEGVPSARVFMLDMAVMHASWVSMPALPLPMSHSVAITQSNGKHACIYVIGGRSSKPTGISELHNQVFCFDPVLSKWSEVAKINDGQITNLSAATAVARGTNGILVIGGDKGDIFHRIETYNAQIAAATGNEKERLQAEKVELLTHHPGFSRDVLLYNTLTNSWKKVGMLPFYGHVTSTALIWNKDVFIPGGEIKPGIRTADIAWGEIYGSY